MLGDILKGMKNKNKPHSKKGNNPNENVKNAYNEDDVSLEICDGKDETDGNANDEYDRCIGINPDPNKLETTRAKSLRTGTSVQYIVHDVNWSGIFDEELLPTKPKWNYDATAKHMVFKGRDAWTISILSPSQCGKLVELCELYGFEDCGYPPKYRSNTRLITNDPAFAAVFYERIKACCPQRYQADGKIWRICGLNERFRWCKYVKGQKFGKHCDARFSRNPNEISFYTVNVYLNCGKTEFSGGRTCFFEINEKKRRWDIVSAVTASTGTALIFNQYPENIEHNGEEVTSGTKYLMRTDVMYRASDVELDEHTKWKTGPL